MVPEFETVLFLSRSNGWLRFMQTVYASAREGGDALHAQMFPAEV